MTYMLSGISGFAWALAIGVAVSGAAAQSQSAVISRAIVLAAPYNYKYKGSRRQGRQVSTWKGAPRG